MKNKLFINLLIGILSFAALSTSQNTNALSSTLGTILFPPGQPNTTAFRVDLDSDADAVITVEQTTGDTAVWLYDANGRGLRKIGVTLVALDVNEQMPLVTFTQYLHTGSIFSPNQVATSTTPGVMEGTVTIDGIPTVVSIDGNTTPSQVTVNFPPSSGINPLSSPVYPQTNYAPFVIGNTLYAVEPTAGSFMVHKWFRYTDGFTTGIYSVPSAISNVANPVISEVQITGGTGNTNNDFIELYNPLNVPFDLAGYRLVKRTASTTNDTTIKSWNTTTTPHTIPPHGFYLWANSAYSSIPTPADTSTSIPIADNNSIALRLGDENTGTVIDTVSWGAVNNSLGEGSSLLGNLGANQSYERKVWQGIACFNASGIAEYLGNGCDTGNNASDFSLRGTANPQNSSSPLEP